MIITVLSKKKIETTKTQCGLRVVPIIDELYKALIDWKVIQGFKH